MKLRKILMAGAIVSSMVLAMTTAAFADYDLTVSHNAGVVSVDSGIAAGDRQLTVLIVPVGKDVNVAAEDILYINQEAYSADVFKSMGVKGGTLADGEYLVKVGSENVADGIKVGLLTISTTPIGRTLQLGDVDFADGVQANDALAIMNVVAGSRTLTGDAAKVADVDQADGIQANDALAVMNCVAGTRTLGTITVYDN